VGGDGGSSGLVLSSTSQTPSASGLIELDRYRARATRMRKSILTGARLLVEEGSRGGFRGRWAMLTATYRQDGEWGPRHVSELLSHVYKWLRRRGCTARFVWCLELTKAKRPHYHVLLWLPRGLTIPKPDKQGWWPWGSTRIEWARRAVGYVAKYASKAVPDAMRAMPKGARTHGVGGLQREGKRELRWWKAPTFVREGLGAAADIRKVQGGYADKCNGVFLRSPWHVHIGDRGRIFVWRDDHECCSGEVAVGA
jgi:hypothetical protein